MLGFACIRDCSVCPFSCNRGFESRISASSSQASQGLPEALKQTVVEESQTTEEKRAESPAVENMVNDTKEENLPVLAEVQYSIVKDEERKGLFGWRRKK